MDSTATYPISDRRSTLMQFVPVMLCFFAMGFVDLVGTASNYVQKDLHLTDSQANLFPSLVFFWFLIFSVPTGMLMNRIGRKNTVLISLAITLVSLIVPIFNDGYYTMLVAFSLLGIGNAVMQTSLNPLVSNLIRPDRLASTLTFGQFVKAIASFLAPVIASWAATTYLPTFGLGWRALFVIYAVVCVFSVGALAATPITEEKSDRASGFMECLRLLGRPFILLCFLGIMCHVGIDVGTNTTAPKIIMERLSLPLEEAAFATGIYFIFRTAGCFLGTFLLRVMPARIFFGISVAMMLAAMVMLGVCHTLTGIYVALALVGFGNSNIFSVIFSQALIAAPQEKNEVSGLMIMGLFGGTIFPLAMGFAADAMGQAGAVAVMAAGVAYLVFYTLRIKK
ncbi:MAG: MFS transporter [Muribaculaceae bacterium]|nr:MFS transporter [Muribaculaceae bacterium]